MTQRILKTSIGGHSITVLMGWDRALQYHFMVVEYPGDDEPRYSNLNDNQAGLSGTLRYFAGKAKELGIKIPDTMIARLKTDETLDLGPRASWFDESGNETSADPGDAQAPNERR